MLSEILATISRLEGMLSSKRQDKQRLEQDAEELRESKNGLNGLLNAHESLNQRQAQSFQSPIFQRNNFMRGFSSSMMENLGKSGACSTELSSAVQGASQVEIQKETELARVKEEIRSLNAQLDAAYVQRAQEADE
jgi:DNA repair exonuclease SbcCD ATPase subunit